MAGLFFEAFVPAPINTFNKLLGDLYYSKELSDYPLNYQVRDFKESIKVTETDE